MTMLGDDNDQDDDKDDGSADDADGADDVNDDAGEMIVIMTMVRTRMMGNDNVQWHKQ